MGKEKTYTLTLSGQELRDVIEAALVCECQNAQIVNGMKRKGLDLDAQKLVTQNARLARLVRRMQETEQKEEHHEKQSCRAARDHHSRARVYVLIIGKGFKQLFIFAKMRKHSQLNLRIIKA